MLRRLATVTHSRGAGCAAATFSTTAPLRLEADAGERDRELQLRQQVMQKYSGMQVPEMTDYTYGHFATTGVNGAAANQAYRDVAGQGFARGFGFPGAGASNNITGSNNATGGNGGGENGGGGSNTAGTMPQPKVDWLMLFTGVALVYFSGKIIYSQMTRGVDGIDLPLWTASIDRQALHLLFCVQFDREERENIKKEFQTVRQQYPLTDFYEWLHSRRSEFGSGRRYRLDQTVGVLINSLSSSDSTQLMELARTLQRSVDRRGGDSLARVDDFMDKLATMRSGVTPQSRWAGGMPSAPHQPSFQPPNVQLPTMNGTQQMNVHDALNASQSEPHASKPF